MPNTIRVAIIGGGIMGCTLANGLLQHSHIDWQIFERKSSFVERGATVGWRDNATKALAAMGLKPDEMYRKSGAVVSDASRNLIAVGDHKGEPINELPAGHLNIVRTRWLDVLLERLPEERLHANKKLSSVDHLTGDQALYKLNFDDGDSFTAHAIIGCDGIHSLIRKMILEDKHPDLVSPLFGGYWDARGSTTPKEAAERFGSELFDPLKSDEIALTGDGAFMLFCPSEDGSKYAVIVSAAASPDFDPTAWKATLSREFLENAYRSWDRNFRDAVIDCMMADDSGPGTVFSQWMTPETPTYCRQGLCIAGDAAHSMLPYMGCGAAMAMEDSAVLAAVLAACGGPEDVTSALQAFDYAQRERNESVVKKSQVAAKLMTGQLGLDPVYIASLNPSKWWTDIMEIDMEGHIEVAVKEFNRLRKS